jgi:hypothetical protein
MGNLRMQSQPARRRRLRLFGLLSFAVALSALAVTKALPYASFLMTNSDTSVADSDPRHGFSVGSVRWEVEQFSSAPGLAPFRRYFFKTCGGQTGIQAAMCLSQAFDGAFPAGTPKHEFLERHFDPDANFEAHLSGEPGHCVNRSAMLATTLLSVGIPARVASFSPRTGRGGHTLVEVWAGSDWVLADPTEVGLVGSIRPSSAPEVKRMSESLRLFNPDGSVRQDPYLLSKSIVRGELVYPEPWLYTRTGPRFSFWPFRGRFIQVGVHSWRFSTPLFLCRVAFVICIVAGLYFLACLLFSRGGTEAADPRLSRKPVTRAGELNVRLQESQPSLLARGDRSPRRAQP